MTPNKVQRWLDLAAVAALAGVCVSGAVLRGALPESARIVGIAADPRMPGLFGLTNGEWSGLHDSLSFLFLLLLLPNLFWERAAIRGLFTRRADDASFIRAAVGAIAALTLAVWVAAAYRTPRSPAPTPFSVKGGAMPMLGDVNEAEMEKLSFSEIAERMRVPVAYMQRTIGLPPDVDADVPVKALMPRYRFTIADVQAAILSHRIDERLARPQPSPRGGD